MRDAMHAVGVERMTWAAPSCAASSPAIAADGVSQSV